MHGISTRLRRFAAVTAGAVLALGMATAFAGSASAAPSALVCSYGSIPGGSYSSVTVTGECYVDSGNVNVTGNVTVKPWAELFADFGGSDLHVVGNVSVGAFGVLVLGCAPIDFSCENDSSAHPTLSTHHSIGGNVTSNGAYAMIIHDNNIGGFVKSVNADFPDCNGPGYYTFEDNRIGGDVTINKISTCWMGFIRNKVAGTVVYNNNDTVDPDGNEIVTNQIAGDLKCKGNDPAPQVGDSEGSPNIVGGVRTGQCKNI